jgi:hypothetical protein
MQNLNVLRRLSLVVALVAIVLTCSGFSGCSASSRHIAVVADQSAYESLNDTHALEQTALCGLPSCAGSTVVEHTPGWTLAKSQAFNTKLLPAVRGGQQFNELLAGWKPGTPVPVAITDAVTSIGNALGAVVADFPPGETRTTILANLGSAQAFILNAFNIVLTVKGA